MRFNSIRFKTNILYTVILGIILCVYSGILFYAVRTILYRDLDESLRVKAREVGDIIYAFQQVDKIQENPLSFLLSANADKKIIDDLWRSEVKTLNLKSDYIHILTGEGRLVLSSQNVGTQEVALFRGQLPFAVDRTTFGNLRDEGHYLRAINSPISYSDQLVLIVQIGTPLDSIVRTLDKLKFFIFLTIFSVLVLTSFLGSVFVRGILNPVRKIAETANNISHKGLHIRVEEKQSDEEIRYLIKSFNTMLARLELSFGHINEFSSLVAHELKTPLAVLRGEMELALAQDYSPEELKKVLERGMEEVNRIIRIIKDLLLLANLDYRTDVYKFERIDLAGFITDICENGQVLAKEKNIEVSAEVPRQPLLMNADKVHLRRLFFNLIHNAIKFTPAQGEVRITLKEQNKKAVISIEDTGIGIAREDVSRLFTKFFRVAKEQDSPESGNGLGLSIALSIAKAHQGEISVLSEVGQGSVFTVTLPLI